MATILLITGLNKTGTQSLQATCMRNRAELARRGVVYPAFEFGDGWQRRNHNPLLESCFGRLEGVDAATREQARAALKSTLGDAQRVILAAPELSGFAPAHLGELRRWMRAQGHTLQPTCMVRHLSSWTHSFTAQRVTGRRRRTIEQVVQTFSVRGFVRWRIELLKSVFPKLRFGSFESALKHPQGPAGAILESFGVDIAGLKFVRANESASDAAVRAISELNARDRTADITKLLELPGPRFRLLPAEFPPELVAKLDEERAWLGTALGERFAGGPIELKPAA
ncbi:hypothetical protein [Ramlibacter sp. PS4R-6]|uniref:hypothetical protein n=1 Tax=Ramlibacter sp. PS4R-6 TaxID=3133438 RepID=UPI00309FFFAE